MARPYQHWAVSGRLRTMVLLEISGSTAPIMLKVSQEIAMSLNYLYRDIMQIHALMT